MQDAVSVIPLQIYKLYGPRFLNPTWFNRIKYGSHDGIVSDDGEVVLDNQILQFSSEKLAPGTVVVVSLNQYGFFVCSEKCEYIRHEQETKQKYVAEEKARDEKLRIARDLLRKEAEEFNAKINIPAKFEVGFKDVLSGLSERSMGTGRNKATVNHILLLEPLVAGRIVRKEGDFLCTAKSGSNGKRWSGTESRAHDGSGDTYAPKITCKACLSFAKKWIK